MRLKKPLEKLSRGNGEYSRERDLSDFQSALPLCFGLNTLFRKERADMLKGAIKEVRKYKRLPILNDNAWKCVFTTLVISIAIVMAG